MMKWFLLSLLVFPFVAHAEPGPMSGGSGSVSGSVTVVQATGSNLHMVCDSGCTSSSAPADEATFTFGTTPQTPIGGVYQTTATSNALTSGQMGAAQLTINRAMHANLRNATGTEVGTSTTPFQVSLANTAANATAVKTDGSAVTQPISGAVTISGVATSANQTTANSSLATIATNTTSIATSALQTTANTSLATIATNTGAAIPAGTNLIGNAGILYPAGSTPLTASATGTTGATTATLAGTSAKSTYLCGYSIRANATAAATGNATVTGTITGTLNFTQWTAPNASGLGINEQLFSPCVIASGTNQAIAVVSAAPGTGGVVSVSAWGFQL